MRYNHIAAVGSLILSVSAQQLASDPGIFGPKIELVHIYNDEFATGIAVSAKGRKFSTYPPALDLNNTKYSVAELNSFNTEVPYPSAQINSPPGGSINYTTFPPTGANYQNYLVGAQSVVIDSKDRLWILDVGRALTSKGVLVQASYGGPKLVGVDLGTNKVIKTIVFPPTVAFPDSYLNDIRFDLRPYVTKSGQGIGYITDSSPEGHNGIVVVDLGSGESWRHLDGAPQVRAQQQFFATIWGENFYSPAVPGLPVSYLNFGADGLAISADGDTIFWTDVGSRYLYSIPATRLRDRSEFSELLAQGSIVSHGEIGVTAGLETDTHGYIYVGNMEQNAINIFDPATGATSVFVRDPRIGWVDTMSVATDGFLYFTVNQLWRSPDRRVKPYALFRVNLPGSGSKISL